MYSNQVVIPDSYRALLEELEILWCCGVTCNTQRFRVAMTRIQTILNYGERPYLHVGCSTLDLRSPHLRTKEN